MRSAISPNPSYRLEQILSPSHPLCRNDIIWVLEFVKKNVAEQNPAIWGLPQPRLMRNFQYFAEAATALIQPRPFSGHEADRLRAALKEASFGLWTDSNATGQRKA